MSEKEILKGLQIIPGVGKSISEDLYGIGVRKVADLKRKDPQALYDALCRKAGAKIDRCMLYVMRGAVYFASTPKEKQNSDKLLWWNWKDR